MFTWVFGLGWFHSHHFFISTKTFRRTLAASVDMQLRGNEECPFSGVTKSGRVWKKVPESVVYDILPSTTAVFSLRHRVQKTAS